MLTTVKKHTFFTSSMMILVAACLGLYLAPGIAVAGTGLNPSPELRTLLRQAESTFMKPMGLDLKLAIDHAPVFLAMTTGLAMHRQMKYLNQHPEHMERFDALKDQALAFLNEVAKVHNYINPEDGTRLSEAQMGLEFYEGLNGEPNDYFIEQFNIDPAQVELPMILAQVPEPGPDDDGPLGAFHQKSDGLVLLGQRADLVEHDIDMRPLDPTPSAPPLQLAPIEKGAIVGNWEEAGGMDCSVSEGSQGDGRYIRFQRGSGNDLYVGRQSGKYRRTVRIRSEKQIDQYTMEYTGKYVELKTEVSKDDWYGEWLLSDKPATFRISRGKKNGILMCRDIHGLIGTGYIKRN